MTITVAELLAEPQLGLSLLAGSSGLDHPIAWAHTSDLPRLWEWVTGGELMMTNGLSLPADAAGQVAFAEALAGAGASALAIGEKMHAPPLSQEFLDTCDRLSLPVLNIPYPLPFIAIARSVAESSLLEQSHRLRQTARIYDLIGRAGAAEQHWQNLISGLAAELNTTLFVLDRHCLHPWYPDGEPLTPEVAAGLELLVRIPATASKSFQWHILPDGRHILLMDIPTHPNALLVVLPKAEAHPDAVILLHAATVLGLELSRTTLDLENQRRLGAEFLSQAFEGGYSTADVERRLQEFGVTARQFLIVTMGAEDLHDLDPIHIGLWRHGYPNACLRRFNRLHLAVGPDCSDEILRHVVSARVRIGVSQLADAAGIGRALQESLWASGTAASNSEQLAHYAQGPAWLGLTSYEEGNALVRRLLGPVFDYERGRQPDLMITLKTFLTLQRSWQKTAAELFTHRQTIIYRIRKISELTGLDLTETSSIAQLWFALQIHEAMETHGHQPNFPAGGR
ncbi:PucR family transcriptional regulator [Pseudarthrobacter sp. O4]|uniref:PucR family transcriptional regulator n=1 Tax=Pseudarthrobacter sp. O4 TaxID=3418417 RepID=UPI003CECFC88